MADLQTKCVYKNPQNRNWSTQELLRNCEQSRSLWHTTSRTQTNGCIRLNGTIHEKKYETNEKEVLHKSLEQGMDGFVILLKYCFCACAESKFSPETTYTAASSFLTKAWKAQCGTTHKIKGQKHGTMPETQASETHCWRRHRFRLRSHRTPQPRE